MREKIGLVDVYSRQRLPLDGSSVRHIGLFGFGQIMRRGVPRPRGVAESNPEKEIGQLQRK